MPYFSALSTHSASSVGPLTPRASPASSPLTHSTARTGRDSLVMIAPCARQKAERCSGFLGSERQRVHGTATRLPELRVRGVSKRFRESRSSYEERARPADWSVHPSASVAVKTEVSHMLNPAPCCCLVVAWILSRESVSTRSQEVKSRRIVMISR